MKLLRTASLLWTGLMALAASGGCSSHVSEGGSETNWLCSDDGDCGAGQRCVERKCAAAVMGGPDAGAAGGAGGAGGSGGNAGDGANSDVARGPTTTQFTDVIHAVCTADQCLTGRCLPLALDRNGNTGKLPCSVIDVTSNRTGCDLAVGLAPPSAKVLGPVKDLLTERGLCGVVGTPSCATLSFCAVQEATGDALQSCLNDPTLPVDALGGWCYVDPDHGTGSVTVVGQCAGSEHRLLRVFPRSEDHTLVITCFEGNGEPTSSPALGTGKIGDPFIPEDETRAEFSGYSASEVNVEAASPSCETGIGLVYAFTGRVTCPYGQPPDPNDPSHADSAHQSCLTPSGAPVSVPVNPQSKARRPSDAVYCSCRCDGPDTNAAYCNCPTGFECKSLVQDYGFGSAQFAGSFCIKSGTDYTPGIGGSVCDRTTQNCGPP